MESRSLVICKQAGRYIGWPTVTRDAGGVLWVAFSGDRQAHICPYGKTQCVRSDDGGCTWSKPVTINHTPLDDRDAGILVTSRGTLLVSWFTSLAFEEATTGYEQVAARIADADRQRWLGNWIVRSTDGGQSWSPPIDSIVTAPHGPIQLADGRLLFLGINQKVGTGHKPPAPRDRRIAAAESVDDGQTWRLVGFVPIPEDMPAGNFHEPHVVEAADGALVGMIRHQGQRGSPDRVLWQTRSTDGGRTWTQAQPTPIWGLPPHLIRLHDDRLLVTYGHRRPPCGQRACLSVDHGRTWDYAVEIQIRDDAPNGDLGYPASVQMDETRILSVYYQIDQPGEKTSLLGTFWNVPAGGG